MTITVIRSKQIPDRIELVEDTGSWVPDTWGVRYGSNNNALIRFVTKEEAIEAYDALKDEFDIEDFFGFRQHVA